MRRAFRWRRRRTTVRNDEKTKNGNSVCAGMAMGRPRLFSEGEEIAKTFDKRRFSLYIGNDRK